MGALAAGSIAVINDQKKVKLRVREKRGEIRNYASKKSFENPRKKVSFRFFGGEEKVVRATSGLLYPTSTSTTGYLLIFFLFFWGVGTKTGKIGKKNWNKREREGGGRGGVMMKAQIIYLGKRGRGKMLTRLFRGRGPFSFVVLQSFSRTSSAASLAPFSFRIRFSPFARLLARYLSSGLKNEPTTNPSFLRDFAAG